VDTDGKRSVTATAIRVRAYRAYAIRQAVLDAKAGPVSRYTNMRKMERTNRGESSGTLSVKVMPEFWEVHATGARLGVRGACANRDQTTCRHNRQGLTCRAGINAAGNVASQKFAGEANRTRKEAEPGEALRWAINKQPQPGDCVGLHSARFKVGSCLEFSEASRWSHDDAGEENPKKKTRRSPSCR